MSEGLALSIAGWTTVNAIVWMLIAGWALRSKERAERALQKHLDATTSKADS